MPDRPPPPHELARLADRLASMPLQPRQVFERHRFDDTPLEVIAADLDLDIHAVERLLANAMVHLDCEEP